ncbi:MAG: bifunctional riboflavin kinase/FAD synthetase [Congregibacter sp.]
MQLLRGLSSLGPHVSPSVATIGAFDGVHLGHQAVLEQLREQGERWSLPTTVISFEPLPREYLAVEDAPARLQSLRDKLVSLRAMGVDRFVCLRFGDSMKNMSAPEFADRLFFHGLSLRALVVGDDFRFGREREGGFDFIRAYGETHGFETLRTRTISIDGERVSSTRLRAALSDGDFALAERLLGRPFELSGRVAYGKQLGRQIGVPTANISLRRATVPVSGVFSVRVSGGGLTREPAIANVGTRPTVDAGSRANLEVHILSGDHELYGERLSVSFEQKLRDEKRYDSFELLKAQIYADIEQARGWFNHSSIDAIPGTSRNTDTNTGTNTVSPTDAPGPMSE